MSIFLFILAIVLALIGIGIIVAAATDNFASNGMAFGVGVLILVLGGGGAFLGSTLYKQSVGEARVIVDAGGAVTKPVDLTPGWGFKAPWSNAVTFNLLSLDMVFAGSSDSGTKPSYVGDGNISGYEVTGAVKDGTGVNMDMQVTYSLDGEAVLDIYEDYRSQEAFTQQVLVNGVLNEMRTAPSAFTPIEFRGEKRGVVQAEAQERLTERFAKYGVTITGLNIQDVRYSQSVEESLQAVQVAQQQEATAQAEKRAAEVEAEKKVVEAQGEADANRIRGESLTPEVLEAQRLETLKSIGEKGNLVVVPEGTTPFVQVQPSAPTE